MVLPTPPASARLLVLLALSCLTGAASAAAQAHPNVVIFLAAAAAAGWGDYSRNGNRQIRTPRIDAIAREGATFDRPVRFSEQA